MKIEIWSDVVCPWCYIGKRRFEAALGRFDGGGDIDIVYRPFMLDPSAPTEGRPVSQVYERKFGGPEAAGEILKRVTAEAKGEGLEFRMDIALRANTLPAHRLLELGRRQGCQHELKERLMRAYFTEGVDIGDHEVLVSLGVEVGLEAEVARGWLASDGGRAEVVESLEFAVANGVASVPTYVFDRRIALPGAQDPDTFLRILERVSSTEGPEQFTG